MYNVINVIIITWSIVIIGFVAIIGCMILKDFKENKYAIENNYAFKNKKQNNEIVANWSNALALSKIKDSYAWINADGKYFHILIDSTQGIDINRPRKLYVDGVLIAIL